MSKLFIYYSNTGNGDIVAYKMESLGYDVRKVMPKKELPKSFFFKVMTGGFLVGLNVKSKLVDYDNNVSEYEEIVIGSPIWNDRLSTPINSVLDKTDLNGKNVRFILYAGSGTAKKVFKQLEKVSINPDVTFLKEPKKYPDELEKLV